jgi:hypothetical protein
VVVVELPLRRAGFRLPDWDELVAISAWCRAHGVKLHFDGARLWESAPHYGRSLAEICALADSVYVSFYRAWGGLAGNHRWPAPADFIAALALEDPPGRQCLHALPDGGAERRWTACAASCRAMAAYRERARALAAALADQPGAQLAPSRRTRNSFRYLPADPARLREALLAQARPRASGWAIAPSLPCGWRAARWWRSSSATRPMAGATSRPWPRGGPCWRAAEAGSSGLRPVVALDQHDVGLARRRTQRDQRLVLASGSGPAPPGGWELQHYVAAAAVALRRLEGATAHQEAGAEACEHRAVALRVLLALGVVHVHAGDPVALGHGGSRCWGRQYRAPRPGRLGVRPRASAGDNAFPQDPA